MEQILQYLVIFALQSAAVYAIAASGLVVTYTTSGIFNFAHGAIGMVVAFFYWQMTSDAIGTGTPLGDGWGLHPLVALPLCLLVVAPLLGWVLDRVIMRRLAGASTIAGIVATIGLLFALVQIVGIVWPQTKPRKVERFFGNETFELFGTNVLYHRTIALAVAVAVAFGLRAFLFNTRLGTAMRAVVDSRDLAALNGADPDRVSSAAWMLGCSLAGLAGILIAPELPSFTAIAMTLLVIQAYAAAMVGRLRSLPLTFLGAVILAELEQVTALISRNDWLGETVSDKLSQFSSAMPVLLLLGVLVFLREDRGGLRSETFGFRVPRPPVASVAKGMGALFLVLSGITYFELFTVTTRLNMGRGIALGIVILSLVLLTGWAGQVSLAQLALSGLCACTIWKWGPYVGLVGGVLICAAVGALVALPALRMRSLYLALTTMAFALLLETVVYGNTAAITSLAPFASGRAFAERPGFLASDKVYFVVMALVFVAIALGLTVIRNGPFGRRLAAMKDSPDACATLGMDLTATKFQVFVLASAMAGLGGGLLAMWNSNGTPNVGSAQYGLLEGGALAGLPLLLVAVIGGITSVFGAVFAAFLFIGMPLLGSKVSWLKSVMNVAPGLAGIGLAKSPDGAVRQMADGAADVKEAIAALRAGKASEATATTALSPEAMLADGRRLTDDEVDHLDHVLGLSWGRDEPAGVAP